MQTRSWTTWAVGAVVVCGLLAGCSRDATPAVTQDLALPEMGPCEPIEAHPECTGCLNDSSSCHDPALPRCEPVSHKCVACLVAPARDNCPAGQFCVLDKGEYRCSSTCGVDADCVKIQGGGTCCSGACLDLTSDAKNCGACGIPCVPGPHEASVACVQSACTHTCAAGFWDCDGRPVNGCELADVDLLGDPKNCSACGVACPPGQPACAGGKCFKPYAPVGPQNNVAVADLVGWTECYKGVYTDLFPLAQIELLCPRANLMLSCRKMGAPTLDLLAWAPRDDVFFDTGGANVGCGVRPLHRANGTDWYFNDSWSWGFTAADDPPMGLCSCDQTIGNHPEQRMCWSTSAKSIASGYRCGASLDKTMERIIYEH